MTVGRMLREMTVKEYAHWQVFYREDPFGDDRADLRAAQGHALLANINRDPKKHDKPFEAIDFMAYAKRRQEMAEKTADEGAKVDPMTFAWMMSQARKTEREKNGK